MSPLLLSPTVGTAVPRRQKLRGSALCLYSTEHMAILVYNCSFPSHTDRNKDSESEPACSCPICCVTSEPGHNLVGVMGCPFSFLLPVGSRALFCEVFAQQRWTRPLCTHRPGAPSEVAQLLISGSVGRPGRAPAQTCFWNSR